MKRSTKPAVIKARRAYAVAVALATELFARPGVQKYARSEARFFAGDMKQRGAKLVANVAEAIVDEYVDFTGDPEG